MLANCLDPLTSIVSKIFYHTRPIPDHGKNIPGILTCPVILLDPLIGYVSKTKQQPLIRCGPSAPIQTHISVSHPLFNN